MKLIKNVLVIFLFLFVVSVSAQEYILLKTGDKITANIISITNDNLRFKLFDEADTTLYFLKKENVLAIGFGSDIYKRLKDVKQKNVSATKPINVVVSPDFIYPKTQEKIKVYIDSITPTQVLFRMASPIDTVQYFINKSEVFQISFSELSESASQNEFANFADEDLIFKAKEDAKNYYKGYVPAATLSFFAPLFFGFGIPIPIITATVPSVESSMGYPDMNFAKNLVYKTAYRQEARRIKAGRVWLNFGISVTIIIGITIYLNIIIPH